jgi:DNA-binding response OmpR family regulator
MSKASTILVVDDEETTRTTVARILRAEGHVVIPIKRGVDAQRYVERLGSTVDLVVADFARPESDDYHLGITIGALLRHTPVLFISSCAREDGVRAGLLHPSTPFLQKPFPPGLLARRVRALLERAAVPPAA